MKNATFAQHLKGLWPLFLISGPLSAIAYNLLIYFVQGEQCSGTAILLLTLFSGFIIFIPLFITNFFLLKQYYVFCTEEDFLSLGKWQMTILVFLSNLISIYLIDLLWYAFNEASFDVLKDGFVQLLKETGDVSETERESIKNLSPFLLFFASNIVGVFVAAFFSCSLSLKISKK